MGKCGLAHHIALTELTRSTATLGILFSTIALDIADLDPQWKQSLCTTLSKGVVLSEPPSAPGEQFEKFILEPAKALTIVGPIVIVIDALDESGTKILAG
jgi:hypothetical protein